MVWWLHSKAEDRGKYSDNAKDDDSPYIILMNNQMPPTNEDDSKYSNGSEFLLSSIVQNEQFCRA